MNIHFNSPKFMGKNTLIILIIAGILSSVLGFWVIKIQKAKAESFSNPSPALELSTMQGNSLLSVFNSPLPELQPIQRVKMVITAYSSTPWQTDSSPYITASGKTVEEGIIANNMLTFGTKIRIPELYGDKIFTVEDRMNWRKGYYHLDIWFPEYWQAKNFGAKRAYIEILES